MKTWTIAAIGAVLLASANSVEAGIYCTFEKPDGPTIGPEGVKPLSYQNFWLDLSNRIDLRNPAKETARAPYLKRRDELQEKVKAGTASLEDKINLSACLIALAEYQEAIALLMPVANERGDPKLFMVHANLGTAYQLAGQVERAGSFLTDLKYSFPPAGQAVAGYAKEQLDWYRVVEKVQLQLLMQRAMEQARLPAGRPPQMPESLDLLFPVQFVGESGAYEAGSIAAAEKAKLPKDALARVQQLLLWLPDETRNFDMRLFWLMGELLNAQGDVVNAKDVMDRLADGRKFFPRELREHRQVLDEYVEKKKAQAKAAPPTTAWLPDTNKLILVGAATGAVIAFLAFLQLREMRRRRQASLR